MEVKRTHPLIITAAAAVILTCGIAIASMTGLLPSSNADANKPEAELAALEAEAGKADPSAANAPTKSAASKPSSTKPANTAHSSGSSAAKPAPTQVAAICNNCGRVVDVRAVKVQGEGTGLGAVAGGVAGALLGKQFGNGNGQKAMTVAGAVGGAVLGNKIEKDQRGSTVYDVVVEFEDGSTSTYREGGASWQVGDRVKVVNGQITSNI